MDHPRLESAVVVDVEGLSAEVRASLESARSLGQPVFFVRRGHFVGLMTPISDEEGAWMTRSVLAQMAREIAARLNEQNS
jgi:hypothetical protein